MRKLMMMLVAVSAILTSVVVAAPAQATSRAVIIHNSQNSEAGMGIVPYGSSQWKWILQRGTTWNNRSGPASLDARGYFIGAGWCARTYVWNLDTGTQWVFVGTVGPGNHYPLASNRVYGIEQHPANRGGVHGCG